MFIRRFVMLAVSAVAAVGVGAPAGTAAGAVTAMWHRPIVVIGANQSSNWSGYNQGTLEQGNKLFNAVSGTWRVPTATPHQAGEAEFSSTWVGIGGGCVDATCQVTDATLIQAGTEQDMSASGTASYSAWWEVIPAPSIKITMTVHANDLMSVSIAETVPGSEVWTITVKNLTSGGSFTQTVPYPSTHLTAEWIEETPVVVQSNGNVSIGPLPNLSRVRFNGGTTNGKSAGLIASEEIQLADPNSGAVLLTPSKPDPDKNGFNACTYASSCPAPTKP